MKLIDKDALVADIERRIKTNKGCMLGLRNLDYYKGKVDALNDTISSLDTLETKEVDLDEEVDKWYDNEASKEFENVLYKDIEKCAKHFYELGLKAQKGE